MSNPSIGGVTIPSTQSIEDAKQTISEAQYQDILAQIQSELINKNAVLIAHYYVDEYIQRLAEDTGGFVSDSLDMARFGKAHTADVIVVAGVRFMGETAKILSPEKTVLMPKIEAECSLDLGCDADVFSEFIKAHPDRKVVVYSNTSARVKAMADFVVTSGIALKLVEKLKDQGDKIIWAPDKHLGRYIQKSTGADMLLWDASCIVHDEFKSHALSELLDKYPDAAVLVHPESPDEVIQMADVVGSTTQIIKAAERLPNQEIIVATDRGIFHKMRQTVPDKTLIAAPTFGVGGSCVSCAHCPWMAMNSLQSVLEVLQTGNHAIEIDEAVRVEALKSTERMFDFL